MTKYTHCVECKRLFSALNVFSREGWLETQISGVCEECFDDIFSEEEEDYDLHD